MTALYENEQWIVTEDRIKTAPGIPDYEIYSDRLLELTKRGSTNYYDWPLHMAEKTWVDVPKFHNAFVQALTLHEDQYKGSVDLKMLEESLALGRGVANRRGI